MISDARGGHVSPGIYTEERDVTYSVKSLGITSLGLAGETLKGPAFQPIAIKDWAEFTTYFGGTSSTKFKGNNLPKYELPYIAKEYLKESRDLTVCRVLGLSGYKNGAAHVVNVEVSGITYPVAIMRSKIYDYTSGGANVCGKNITESYQPKVTKVEILSYSGVSYNSSCEVISGTSETYPLSGYIFSDTANGATYSGAYTVKYPATEAEIAAFEYVWKVSGDTIEKISASTATVGTCVVPDKKLDKFALKIEVSATTECKYDTVNVSLNADERDYILNAFSQSPLEGSHDLFVEALYDYSFEAIVESAKYANRKITFGYQKDSANDSFREPFRPSVSPWVVSEVVSDTERADMKRLFKFYTISDGNASNYQVKISIQNIRPDDGLFDVVIRDFYDSDSAPYILERYSNCSLVKGSSNYIGLLIGTFDGEFEAKSKYVTVRMNDEATIEGSVPCGFLGYPIPNYSCTKNPYVKYNRDIDDDVRIKRQYFGLNITNLDEDILNYKGVNAYSESDFTSGSALTNGFHLDSILSEEFAKEAGKELKVYVEGLSGFTFTAVNPQTGNRVEGGSIPRIVTEAYAKGTIYEDKNARKFTMYTYGGFDGWDIFRKVRTNTDDYKANKYQDNDDLFNIGEKTYKEMNTQLDLKLPTNAIASDYYAYLGAYNQFKNPEDVDINVFATPGIDWARNTSLVEEVIDIIEDSESRGGDAIYVATTPMFSDDDASEVYTPDELVEKLELTEINSSYVATYWPWVKIYDADEKLYVNLPATKDVVRNMAYTDNNKYPWFSPAGTSRGKVNCERATVKTDLNDEDTLYNGTINPIKTFSKDGVLIWGNKTMYNVDTPLNRVNVRRLMLRIKKLIVSASKELIFEQYDQSLEKQFKNIVEPILSDVKKNRGLHDYRVITECTAETRDQHILPAKILVKPVQSLEYISISFVVTPESVEFTDEL